MRYAKKRLWPGARFNKLTLIRRLPKVEVPDSTRTLWLCRCECGAEKVVAGTDVKRGLVKSCGCLRYGPRGNPSAPHHLFNRWRLMKRRCQDPKDKDYARYGGRGIKVCKRWLRFELFVKDMEPTYAPGLQLDRINNDGNYEPGNCRWATSLENNRNRSPRKS